MDNLEGPRLGEYGQVKVKPLSVGPMIQDTMSLVADLQPTKTDTRLAADNSRLKDWEEPENMKQNTRKQEDMGQGSMKQTYSSQPGGPQKEASGYMSVCIYIYKY